MCENKVKVYISGKIGGLIDRNIPKFSRAKLLLETKGYEAVNPHELDHSKHGKTWEEYMMVDLEALKTCDAIYLLDDWKQSPGAKVELAKAIEMNLIILDEQQILALS